MSNGEEEPKVLTISKAMELLSLSHNLDVCSHFELDFEEHNSVPARNFLGEVLRHNTTVRRLTVWLHDGVLFEPRDGILNFVANNPNLEVLEIQHRTAPDMTNANHMTAAYEILKAARSNPSIRHVSLGKTLSLFLGSEDMPKAPFPANLKELQLGCVSPWLIDAWPEYLFVETLRLQLASDEPGETFSHEQQQQPEYFRNLTDFLLGLSLRPSSKSIRNLEIHAFSPRLSTFLSSPNTALETLEMCRVDFSHTEEGNTSIDGLLLGLAGSNSTVELSFVDCEFDELGIEKLCHGIASNLVKIRHLDFLRTGISALTFRRLLVCENLETLECEFLENIGFAVNPGVEVWEFLRNSTLTTFRCQLYDLAGLGPALKEAIATRNLRKLVIDNWGYTQACVDTIAGLLSSETGHLDHLSLGGLGINRPDVANTLTPIFDAIEAAPLQSLRLHYMHFRRNAVQELGERIEKFNALLSLELILRKEDVTPHLCNVILAGLSKNWNIENVWVASGDAGHVPLKRWPDTTLTTSVNKQIQGLVQRNVLKKQIDSMPVDLTREAKDEWMVKLDGMWSLPNGLDLAFCLLQTRPGCFF